jgi:hypothetical protein
MRRKALASDVIGSEFRQGEGSASRFLIAQGECFVILNGDARRETTAVDSHVFVLS